MPPLTIILLLATLGPLVPASSFTPDAAFRSTAPAWPSNAMATSTAGPSLITDDSTVPGEPILEATYESIGIIAPFSGDANANGSATFRWRPMGSADDSWNAGMSMYGDRRAQITGPTERLIANPYLNQYRASILLIQPATTYEIAITFADPDGVAAPATLVRTVTTRANAWPSHGNLLTVSAGDSISDVVSQAQPGDTVLVRAGTYRERVDVFANGAPDAYLTVQAEPGAVIDASENPADCGPESREWRCGMLITGSYVRVAGFEIVSARIGIRSFGAARGVLDGNHVHQVSFEGGPSMPIMIAASQHDPEAVVGWTIQDNYLEAAPGDPAGHAIHFMWTAGSHVVRRNTIRFVHHGASRVHGSDCLGAYPNQGPYGLGGNNDVHHNLCDGATDDGMEMDGSAMNSRYWSNRITGSNTGFSVAPIDVGPAFLFRNTVHDLRVHWTNACTGLKTGEGIQELSGPIWVVHNTFYLPDPNGWCHGARGNRVSQGTQSGGGGTDAPAFMYNNVFHGWDRSINANDPIYPTLDHNLHWDEDDAGAIIQYGRRTYRSLAAFQSATGQEANGVEARPIYADEAGRDLRVLNGPPPLLIPGINDRDRPTHIGAY